MIKVVHIIVGLNIGGAELMLKRLIQSQSANSDISHTVLSLTSIGPVGLQLRDAGIDVYTLNMENFWDSLFCFFELRRILRELDPDIVHTWMYHSDFIGGIAAYTLGIRNVIWCIRSTDIRLGGSKFTLLIRKACALLSYFLPKVIVCAAEASRSVHIDVGYCSKAIQVIPNGFRLECFRVSDFKSNALRSQLNVGPDVTLIGSVGRYSSVKDHATFIEAAARLSNVYSDVRFLLVGRELTLANGELNELIQKTGWPDRFILLGERNDVPVCLKAMDIFCLHSKTEGFPNVLGEAMALGLPCVTTDVGDAAYLLDQRDYVVPAAEPGALFQALHRIIALGKKERLMLGSKGQQRITNHFSLSKVSQQYADLYYKIMAGEI